MTSHSEEFKVNVHNILVPITMLAITIFLLMTYQTSMIMRDRDTLNISKGQQEKTFQDAQRLQGQLNALLLGTKKLADDGNKNAKAITDKLKDIGIQVMTPDEQKKQAKNIVTKAPVPVATEDEAPAPVKP